MLSPETAYTWGGTLLMDPNKFTIIPTANYKTMPTIPSSNLWTLTWLFSQPTLSHLNSIGAYLLLQIVRDLDNKRSIIGILNRLQ